MSVWLTTGEIATGIVSTAAAWRATARVVRTAAPGSLAPTSLAEPEPRAALSSGDHAAGVRLAGDVHVVLRPVLQEIAIERLQTRGVDLFSDPVAARHLLGEGLWDLVRPHRPPPPDPLVRVLEVGDIGALVDRLEMI